MSCSKYFLIFSIFLCFTFQQIESDDERPFLKVVIPNLRCSNRNESQKLETDKVSIALQTSNGQKLRYSILIDFEMLDGFKNQRHTLTIWRNIKKLQQRLISNADTISLKNRIDISAAELTPQNVYKFRIIGIDDKNHSTEVRSFNITYKDGELKAQQEGDLADDISLHILASDFYYDDMEIILVAVASFCDESNDFYYQWSFNGLNGTDIKDVKGSSLKVPAGILNSENSLDVNVTVFNNLTTALAFATKTIKILSKPFEIQNIPSALSIGVDRQVPIQVIFSQRSFNDLSSVQWTCMQNEIECPENLLNSSFLTQQLIFSTEGTYNIRSEVTLKELKRSSTSNVIVNRNILPHVQMKYFPTQPLNVKEANEVVVTIVNVVPNCIAHWNLIAGDGFADAKEENKEKLENVGLIEVNNMEEQVDENKTLSKDVHLNISEDILSPNEKYKFRLNINCPEAQLNEFQASLQRFEFSKAFNVAVNFLLTQRRLKGDNSTNYEMKITQMLKDELKMLKALEPKGFVYEEKVDEFVDMSMNLKSFMKIEDEVFVAEILSLAETLNKTRMKRSLDLQKSQSSIINNHHGTDYIKKVLKLSEILLSSNNVTIVEKEKKRFPTKVREFVEMLCQDRNFNIKNIKSKSVLVEVSRVYSPQLSVEQQMFPGNPKAAILFSNSNFPDNFICIGKIRFDSKIFDLSSSTDDPTPVYETILLNNDRKKDDLKIIKPAEFSDSVIMEIPLELKDHLTSSMCLIWKDNQWNNKTCRNLENNRNDRITCKCTIDGIFDGIIIR
ncbi:CLUMA_CG014503, isoform A [Clunio marinus]|uniref:CLUMA_CG014503, isoform A n=1 Tax=Clunio marinus TaxID=568069 RepID=A0A1J1IM83_9DIPT|nr:CLUMA_CG014503, isoform A [Clunio marinus]